MKKSLKVVLFSLFIALTGIALVSCVKTKPKQKSENKIDQKQENKEDKKEDKKEDNKQTDEAFKTYTSQILEKLGTSINKEKHNVLVVFSTKKDLGDKLPRLHYWGFEDTVKWEENPSFKKVEEDKQVYAYLISSNKKQDAKDLGFIVTNDQNSKFTLDVLTSNEKLSTYFEKFEQGSLKVIFITSDKDNRQDQDTEGVGIYTENTFNEFLEYIK